MKLAVRGTTVEEEIACAQEWRDLGGVQYLVDATLVGAHAATAAIALLCMAREAFERDCLIEGGVLVHVAHQLAGGLNAGHAQAVRAVVEDLHPHQIERW